MSTSQRNDGDAPHIAFVIKYLENASGGAERVLRDVSEQLCEFKFRVSIVTFDRPEAEAFYPLDSRVQWVKLGKPSASPRIYAGITQLVKQFDGLLALRHWLKQEQPDRTIGFLISAYFPLMLAALGLNLPLYGSEHSSYDDLGHGLKNIALRASTAMLRRTTVISEAIRQTFPPAVRSRMMVVPNPIATPTARASEIGKIEGEKICLAVGRLVSQKDHKTLVDAWAQLKPQFSDWRLRIVGEGQLRPELEAQIERLSLGNRIELPGHQQDVQREYLRAQLMVTPSRYEGLGLVTAEAIAHGLPTVGFGDCPGTNEIIQHCVNEMFVKPSNNQTRAEARAITLSELMEDHRKRLALTQASFSLPSTADIAKRWLVFLQLKPAK